MDVAFLRQISLDSAQVRIEAVFAIAKTSIDRKLAHFESLIEQEFAEFRRVVHLLLGAHRQIEHHENPHQPISAQISRLVHAGSSGSVICASRSEEHTSELQSLMRISYAVFCLKKKKTLNHMSLYSHI